MYVYLPQLCQHDLKFMYIQFMYVSITLNYSGYRWLSLLMCVCIGLMKECGGNRHIDHSATMQPVTQQQNERLFHATAVQVY